MPGPELAVGSGGVDVIFSCGDNVELFVDESVGFSEGDASTIGTSWNHSSIY